MVGSIGTLDGGTASVLNLIVSIYTFAKMVANNPVGINVSGPEFGGSIWPGTLDAQIQQPTPAMLQAFATQLNGKPIFRVPFAVERMQPVLRGPLGVTMGLLSTSNPALANYSIMYKNIASMVKAVGGVMIADAHCYGCRALSSDGGQTMTFTGGTGRGATSGNPTGGLPGILGSPTWTKDDFLDMWVKIDALLGADPTVCAYNLCNEPFYMTQDSSGNALTTVGAQGTYYASVMKYVIAGLRAAGCTKLLIIDAYGFADSRGISGNNPNLTAAYIADPLNNTIVDVHTYVDTNATGDHPGVYNYQKQAYYPPAGYSYDLGASGQTTAKTWANSNGWNILNGELGWPDSPPWLEVGRRQMVYNRNNSIPSIIWATRAVGDYITNPYSVVTSTFRRTGTLMQNALLNNSAFNIAYGHDVLTTLSAIPTSLGTAVQLPLQTILNCWADDTITVAVRNTSTNVLDTTHTLGVDNTNKTFGGSSGGVGNLMPNSSGTFQIELLEHDPNGVRTDRTTIIASVVVTGSATLPVNTSAPVISSVGTVGQTNLPTAGVWSNTTGISGQWYAKDTNGNLSVRGTAGTSPINYTPVAGDVGLSLLYVETASNANTAPNTSTVAPTATSNATAAVKSSGTSLPVPVLIDSFDSMTNRVVVGAATASAIDTSNQIQGTGCFSVTGPASNTTVGSKLSTLACGQVDPQTMSTVVAYFKRLTNGNVNQVNMTIGRGSATYQAGFGGEPNFALGGRWLAFDIGEASGVTGLWNGGVGTITLQTTINQLSPYSAQGVFDAAFMNADGRPTVLFTFDDGYRTTYDLALPAMSSRGMVGTMCSAPNYIGNSGGVGTVTEKMTLAMVQAVYAAGWDCANDGTMDDSAISTDPATAVANLNQVQAYFTANVGGGQLCRGSQMFCWPSGSYSEPSAAALYSAGYKMMRSGNPGVFYTRFGFAPGDAKNFPSFGFSGSTAASTQLANAKAQVDLAVSRGVNSCFHMHYLTDTSTSIGCYYTNVFLPLLDYVKSLRDQGLLDVLTPSQLIARDGGGVVPAG